MTPAMFLRSLIEPRDTLLPHHVSPEVRCLLLAIAGQDRTGWSGCHPWPSRPPRAASGDAPSTARCFAW
jgi:hypothetical protein